MVTWANLPQGNEVSSRLPGGNWGRTDPPASDSSRERNIPSLAPAQPSSSSSSPRAARSEEPARSGGSRPPPLPSPEAGVSFRAGFPAPTPRPRVQESPAMGRGRGGAGRMSPHGKRAGRQAQGQPRPPWSTLRAPDPLGCAPPVPGSLGAALRGAVCVRRTPACAPPRAPPRPHPPPRPTLGLIKRRKRPGAVPGASSLLCPHWSRGAPSPPLGLRRYTTAAAALALRQRGA